MNQYLTFWLGLLLAIPLSLIANLLTPNIRRLLLRWNEKRRSAFEKKLVDENAKMETILADRFKFYRLALGLIYAQVVLLILFFLLNWVLSTAPDLVGLLGSLTQQPADAKAMARFSQELRILNPVLALLFTCMFLLLLQKSFRFMKKIFPTSLHEIQSGDAVTLHDSVRDKG